MVVLVLTACPEGLRGYLSRWLLEISPGVFVGHASSRIRDRLWDNVLDMSKDGKALMVFSTRGEQGLDWRVHRHDWQPVDFEGLTLLRRPHTGDESPSGLRRGWSKASRYRRARR